MGRRQPQREVARLEQVFKREGLEILPCGLPAESGFDIILASRFTPDATATPDPSAEGVSAETTSTVSMAPQNHSNVESTGADEWETLYVRRIGRKALYHQRSRVTHRARLVTQSSRGSALRDSVLRFGLVQRTATALSSAHTVTAERKAMQKLRGHINKSQWRSYVLAGSFREISRKSGLMYVLRRGAPTVVMRLIVEQGRPMLKPLVALCMHPVGYSFASSAGCLCPSDDVIAHLLLIRANEHLFWRKATHHCLEDPLSML